MTTIKRNAPVDFSTDDEKSPDFIAGRLLTEIQDRYDYLEDLKAYLENAPFESAFEQDKGIDHNALETLRNASKMNLAGLIVAATADKLGIDGFRTGAGKDETGDREAMKAFARDEMNIKATYGMQLACSYRSSYLVVDPVSKRQNIIPPNNAAVINDVFGEPVAGVTLQRDRFRNVDIMTLYLRDYDKESGEAKGPLRYFVATRDMTEDPKLGTRKKPVKPNALKITHYDAEVPLLRNLKKGWEWWKSGKVDGLTRVPITPLVNKDGKSEFEAHIPIIDRIHFMIFQRLLIVSMQALRQRAIETEDGKPLPRVDPDTGEEIDYNEEYSADPGAVWVLPPGASLWESSSMDISGILDATKSDVKDLMNHSHTNMTYISDSVNQSAEGAGNQQENYISKIEDRRRRFESRLCRHMSIYFELNKDPDRADMDTLEVIWPPAALESLTDRAAAYQSLKTSGLPMTSALREGMKLKPEEIRRIETESYEEQLAKQVEAAINKITPLKEEAQQAGTTPNAGGNGRSAQAQSQSKDNRKA